MAPERGTGRGPITLERELGRLLALWVGRVARHPGRTLWTCALLFAASVAYAALVNVAMADGHVQRLDHEQLKIDTGHWRWWDTTNDPTAAAAASGGCTCR